MQDDGKGILAAFDRLAPQIPAVELDEIESNGSAGLRPPQLHEIRFTLTPFPQNR